MAEYKNQHYVPQFLLRGWTDDDKVIPFHIENGAEYQKTSISNLCSDDYFYGGPEAEKSLEPLEKKHAKIINKIRDSRSFESLRPDDIRFLCVFVLLQRNRTKQTKEQVEENIDGLAKEFIRLKIKSGEVEDPEFNGNSVLDLLDRVKITREKPLSLPLLLALTGIDQIADLHPAVIVNESERGFVISDHPVVHDNRRFKNEVDRFLVGIQSKGLQIFIPLSDKIQLMLFDPSAYFVEYSNKPARRVKIESEQVVGGLNDFQLINAFESIYYRNSGREKEFNEACTRLSEYIDDDGRVFQRLDPDEHKFQTDNKIIESGQKAFDYSPALPFVKQRLETPFEVQRRPEVAKRHKEFVNELIEAEREKMESED